MVTHESTPTSGSGRAVPLWPLLGALFISCLVVACGPAGPTPTLLPAVTESVQAVLDTPAPLATSIATETSLPPTEPPVSSVQTSIPLTTELKAIVGGGLPPTPTPVAEGEADWGDIEVLALETADGERPLWAAFTVGMGFYDLEYGPFVALYTFDQEEWQELGRVVLTECAQYINSDSLVQVQVEPSWLWLELESYTGAHSGCYDLFSFDGEVLRHEVTHFNSSPGAGNLADLDGDGLLEVILNWTENYIFCYACGVRLPMFDILRWDGEQMAEVQLTLLAESAPADLRRLNDRAVELARAALWKDAQAVIDEALAIDGQDPTVQWNAILISEHADALVEQVSNELYPLLANVFYGDYEAAINVMRPYSMEDLWAPDTPLVVGTVAEGWEGAVTNWITWTTSLALQIESDPSGLHPSGQNLAAAHFLRAWAAHLSEPSSPEVQADVEQAVDLVPDDPLFSQSAAYLAGPLPTEPPAKPTSPPPEATAPATEEIWEVRSLLAGPGEPGRLYALLADDSSTSWPAEQVRFLISDDYGQTWFPFPGGLPAKECVLNLNLDYATPDALYASTCQGLYRWSGSEWLLVSPRETGMVAVVYGQPEIIWATESFDSGAGVFRSDDGGATWTAAGEGMVSFNGVANVAIDPRDANTLYAVIWPKYGGSYLRRGTAAGQWQTMPTPLNNAQIDTGISIDGATGALYVTAFSSDSTWQLWRSLDPRTSDVNNVQWELVHGFGPDVSRATLLASGWSPQGLALYANLSSWLDESAGAVGNPVLHRSLDGGKTWTPLPIPSPLPPVGGRSRAVAYAHGQVYLGVGSQLVILDDTDPIQPQVLGVTPPLPGEVQNLCVADSFVYAVLVQEGPSSSLQVIDVGDPAAPVLRGQYDKDWFIDVSLGGDTSRVAVAGSNLHILDVSDPKMLRLLGTYEPDPPNITYYGVHVVDSLAYAIYHEGYSHMQFFGMHVLDVSEPGAIGLIGTAPTGPPHGISVAGNWAYVAAGDRGLQIVDVSDPTNAVIVSTYDTTAIDVAVSDTHAYLSAEGSLHIVDVSDPSAPRLLSIFGEHVGQVAVAGGRVYVASGEYGLQIFDVSDPTAPKLLGTYDTG